MRYYQEGPRLGLGGGGIYVEYIAQFMFYIQYLIKFVCGFLVTTYYLCTVNCYLHLNCC